MSLLSRGQVRSALRGWVSASDEMKSLERAMQVLYPKRKRPSAALLAETVLFAVLHAQEGQTHTTLTNLSNAMARVLDDLAALRSGKPIEGRTAGMHAADLAVIAKAIDDLDTLQARIKMMLATDESGALVDRLKIDLAASLKGGGKRPEGSIPKPKASKLIPPSFEARASDLGKRIAEAAPTPHGIWNKQDLPAAVARAAHDLVVAAGGDVAIAVKKILATAGPEADAMVIAVLWAEKKIRPGSQLKPSVDHAAHQTAVTGLQFEWTGKPAKESLGTSIGLDGIAQGLVVDAKHSNVPMDTLAHLVDDVVPPKEPAWLANTEQTVEQQLAQTAKEQRPPRNEMKDIWEAQEAYLQQMRRQLDWAEEHGLKGIVWICNDAEHAAAFQRLSERLPAKYKSMTIMFNVGGLH